MKRELKNGIDRIDFASFTEFIEFCKGQEGKTLCDAKTSEKTDFGFFHTNTYKQAIKLAEDGWDEGAKMIKDGIDEIRATGKQYTFSPKYEVSGESVDVGRFLTGEPECMQEWEMIETSGNKVIDIYFNTIASGGYSTQCLINYGVSVLSIVDYLESIGVRCNIYTYYSFSTKFGGNGDKRMVFVKTKSANEALNISTLAFALAHPSMMRRFMFKILESFENFHSVGYGNINEFDRNSWCESDSVIFQTINNTSLSWLKSSDIDTYLQKRLPEILNGLSISTETDFSFIN